MDALQQYRNLVTRCGSGTAAVDALVDAIVLTGSACNLSALFAQLRGEADKIDWLLDSDYAAVALQAALDRVASPPLRQAMLGFALERAQWCAQCSTAGGEGLARSQHVRELESLLAQGA